MVGIGQEYLNYNKYQLDVEIRYIIWKLLPKLATVSGKANKQLKVFLKNLKIPLKDSPNKDFSFDPSNLLTKNVTTIQKKGSNQNFKAIEVRAVCKSVSLSDFLNL